MKPVLIFTTDPCSYTFIAIIGVETCFGFDRPSFLQEMNVQFAQLLTWLEPCRLEILP
jgi:hypothetical protein